MQMVSIVGGILLFAILSYLFGIIATIVLFAVLSIITFLIYLKNKDNEVITDDDLFNELK